MESLEKASEELKFLMEVLRDNELAHAVAEADDETAVTLLVKNERMVVAVKLWRDRTGNSLKDSMDVVDDIRIRHNIPTRK